MKGLVESPPGERILGFTMIGCDAGEVMAAVQTAMMAALPYMKLRDGVFSHLTMVEGGHLVIDDHETHRPCGWHLSPAS